ncbi:AF4/FMR2 family member 1-like protein [Lates japonicus]|uniref:AF4/FMR2 family member 1-like protein n=1 Tax=Lates japonicus TaxID=270547 RepID=A0AAD3MKJ7_LATJO|nr:AF4/FMR2 family member 1-like protein [Lates japonicus]
MASQPSVYNEDRNLLRLRAWEQRIQETSQAKELNPENVPLFGEPYKTNKGDELSNRIQRMLGSYEDVHNPCPLTVEPLPVPSYATLSQSDHGQPNTDKSTKAPFHNQVHHMSTQNQKCSSSNSHSSQPMRTSAASSPNQHGHSSTFPKPPLNHSQGGQPGNSARQQKKSEAFSDLRERVSLPQEMSAQSPDVKPLPFLHSSNHDNTDLDTKDTFDRYQLQESSDHPSESASTTDVSMLNIKQSPKDAPLTHATKANVLPSQTFPPLLSSKQPSVVMTQKPTAYVRPMDGQDQVVSESPELKPSPEPYVPLPELISKSNPSKMKILPQFLETRTNEAQCVEDILRAEHVSSCLEQKSYDSAPPPTDPSRLNQPSVSSSFEAAHSSGVESASSSDSESSSRSESDSESTTEEPPEPPVSISLKTEPDAPAVSDWQLGNWIRSNQQNSSTESQGGTHVTGSPTHKQLLPTQSSKHSSVEVVDPARESMPQLSSHQKELSENLAKPQQCRESPQDNCCQQSSQKSPSADFRKLSCNMHPSKPAKEGCPDHSDAAVSVKCEEIVATRDKDPCFTDRPKSPALQPDQSSPAPPLKIDCSKPKAETTCRRGTKRPHKTTYMHSEKTANTTKGARNLHRPPRSLLVKIDLSLLSRVPQMPGNYQEIPSNGKRSTLAVEQDGGGGDAPTTHKHSKTSKKSIPPNVEVDNKSLPRKKPRLENKNTSSAHVSVKLESSSNPAEERERKRAKKNPVSMQQPATPKDTAKDSKVHKRCSGETQESSKKTVKSKNSCKHKKRSVKNTEHPHSEKQKPPKSSLAVPSSSQSNKEVLINRPLLKFEDRQYPVKHYIKEAKRLKHKADAESDKLSKAFNYLDAAMFFVESGIAMEKDPQISMSSYTMFAETVELLKFVLKLKNPVDPSASPSEKDFLALCLKCQSLLQMAMFRHKHKTALKYSKTLNDHFTNSAQATHEPSVCSSKVTDTPSPMPDMPSPANTSTSSGPGSNHSGSGLAVGPVGSTVAVPQAIEQVAFTYVKITTLFLSAHDIWEQAEELAHKGSGMLTELDTVMGPLSLASTMSSMVRYTRQGVHWLRLDSQKVK